MRWIGLAAALVALQTATGSGRATAPDEPFVAAPYVQIGETPGLLRWEKLDVLWHTADRDAAWRVEYRMDGDPRWHRASASVLRRVAMHGVDPHRVYRATLRDLRSGAPVSYRVLRDGAVVFEASTRARPARTSAFRAVIVGDCADGSAAQRLTAFRMAAEKPDLIVVPGDIVYGQGTIGQYRSKYFPVYNAGAAAADTGAPIARTTPIVGVLGNHDVGGAALDRYADGLAYYLFFSQPMNGPKLDPGGPHATPVRGPGDAVAAFLKSAGRSFPRMANFSFDYGAVHWTCIDANSYVSWDDPRMREWLTHDLKSAPRGAWRFVVFHQPGFSSSRAHFGEQHMRRLSPLFERCGVDVVWGGHVHNYQRSRPLRFVPAPESKGSGPVDGTLTLDSEYDGERVTRARGVIYIVTGGGGARLYNPEQQDDPSSWQPFTVKFVSDAHSFSVADVEPKKVTVRQVDENGKERDRFVLTR